MPNAQPQAFTAPKTRKERREATIEARRLLRGAFVDQIGEELVQVRRQRNALAATVHRRTFALGVSVAINVGLAVCVFW